MMKLTHEQHLAIYTHDQNMIVVAGAGSGKTRVLVERYLALLEKNPAWPLNALVAITFTRKAAQEMRDRVRQSLQGPQWTAHLAQMDSARIDTIHGLCTSLLRANAAEAGIDPGFVVLDETEARILLDDVIDALFQTFIGAGETDDDSAAVVRLFTHYGEKVIRDVLTEFALGDAADVDNVPNDVEAVLNGWLELWQREAINELHYLTTHDGFVKSIEWAQAIALPPDDKLADIWAASWRPLEGLRAFSGDVNEISACVEALDLLRELIKINVGSAKNWGDKETLQIAKDALKAIRECAAEAREAIGEPPTDELHYHAAELLPLWAELIRRVRAAYQQVKSLQGALDFNDLEMHTRDLLYNNPQSDAVRARYAVEFRHVLVDEFQDTNAAQWDIVRALANPDEPGRLFVVGDAKQSIYAFRGADVSVFGSVRQQITAGGIEIPLVRSFRTHKLLVDGFNHIFGYLFVREERSPVRDYQSELGEPMSAEREAGPPDGLPALEIILLDNCERDENGAYRLNDLGKRFRISAEDCRMWEADEIATRLHQMVSDGRMIWDKRLGDYRPMAYGDVALLFQSMSNITLYEERFKALGLPFVTVSGRGYYSRQEVWDLLNLLKALYNTADNLALASALRSPMFNLSDEALLALRLDDSQPSLWAALQMPEVVLPDEVKLVEFARDTLYDLQGLAGRVTISELLNETLARTGYLATLTGLPDGARRRGNVEKLLDKARASGKVTLGAFWLYVKDLSDRETREGEAVLDVSEAVTLMTVHGSKGLEYPVVGLMDTARRARMITPLVMADPQSGLASRIYNDNDELFDPFPYARARRLQLLREEAERKRLLYVAATRAGDYLLISGQVSEDAKNNAWKASGWLDWLLDALQLRDTQYALEPYDCQYAWGNVRVCFPRWMTSRATAAAQTETASFWELDEVRDGQSLPGGESVPPLLGVVRVRRDSPTRYLTATQITDLGGVLHPRDGWYYRQRFRRAVLHDAPGHIERLSHQKHSFSHRKLGEIVHRALRWWRFPKDENDDSLDDALCSYAWEQGITDPYDQARAVRDARSMLVKFKNTSLYGAINNVPVNKVYRELPFIYQYDGRIIHGIIDVLYYDSLFGWSIVDYKTSYVAGYEENSYNQALFAEHVERYFLQVGIYAEAVRKMLNGVVPKVYIHYIRYRQRMEVKEDQWRPALAQLEHYIGDVIGKVFDD